MCGIVGALAFGNLTKDKEAIRQEVMRIITTELLLITESRGKDATGAVLLFNNGNYFGMKRGTKVSSFLSKFGTSKEAYGGLLKVWKQTRSPMKAFVGHCRAGTGGSFYNNMNNHPIKVGNIVGVHNGTLKNDDVIFDNLDCKRDAQVDSEAIFRLAAHFTNNGEEPFTMDVIKDIVHRLEGAFSVIMFNADCPSQIAVFRDARPMEFVFVRELGVLFIISEKPFWDLAHCAYERIVNYYGKDLPSLIKMNIEKGTLDNDGAAIFDLNTIVDEKTVLKDLGEWEKLPGTGRIWKSPTVTYNYNRGTNTAGTAGTGTANKSTGSVNTPTSANSTDNKAVGTDNKTNSKEDKRRYIFDEIRKKYSVKVGDKELNPKESVSIDVDDSKTNDKETNKSSDTNTDDKKTAKIVDITDYSGINKNNKDKADKKEVKETVVNMRQDPPELLEAAQGEYKKLSKEERGFSDMDSMLEAIEVADEKDIKNLGQLYLANRVFKPGWIRGFLAGCRYTAEVLTEKINELANIDEKTSKREKHIVGLKSLVMLLVQYFNKSKQEDDSKKVCDRLTSLIKQQNKPVNLGELESLFHGWQREKLVDIKKAIKEAADDVAIKGAVDTEEIADTASNSDSEE